MSSEVNYFVQMVMAYRSAKIILVANYFNFFTHIQKGAKTPEELSQKLGVHSRSTGLLLNALAALGLLKKENNYFHNTDLSRKFLVEGSPFYMGNNLKFQEIIWDCWSGLKGVIKTGYPPCILEDLLAEKYPGFIEGYIRGMEDIAKGPAESLVKIIDPSRVKKSLDVGGGPGTYSIALARANPGLRAVILDLPPVLKIAKEIVAESGVQNQFEFLEGNYIDTNFGENAFDLILMSHITHNEGELTNCTLFNKAYKALRSGGRIIVHDFLIDESGTLPKFSALFAINLLVYTKEGRAYSFAEYKRWMEEQGFVDVECVPLLLELDNQTSVIMGKRK